MKRRRIYLNGALAAREFLCRSQVQLRVNRRFQPTLLRSEINSIMFAHPPAFRAGFIDTICAFLLITLEGVMLDPQRWEVLMDLDRANTER